MSTDLTLAVIVRDEARRLETLLSHHRPLVQEMVVVDTGSRDDSPAVAAAAGALVLDFRWCDDFSAARNFGIAAARGRWILVLDCDEKIAVGDFPLIGQKVVGPPDRAFALPQWNYCDDPRIPGWKPIDNRYSDLGEDASGFVEVPSCRLIPRLPGVVYQGPVHETPNESLARLGLNLETLPVPIHHQGNRKPHTAGDAKTKLYGELLRKKVKINPHCPATRYEMAVQLVREGQAQLAERLLVRTVHEAPAGPECHRSRLLLARLLQERDEVETAARQIELAVTERPDWPDGWVDLVRVRLRLDQAESAASTLSTGLHLFPHDPRLRALGAQVFEVSVDIKNMLRNPPLEWNSTMPAGLPVPEPRLTKSGHPDA